jgi:hypothetical protein
MSLINKTKWGDCSSCFATDTAVIKVGKDLFCLSCRHNQKIRLQLHKHKVRCLVTKESQQVGNMQDLINDLDIVFSKYIRLKYADVNGIVTCFVCNQPYLWTKIDNGHYISRGNKRTRFMEENCYPQCKFCNSRHNENTIYFKEAIEQYYKGITGYLEEISLDRSVYKYDLSELKQMLVNYTNKLKIVQSKLTINQII